jgi:pilus assembly protein CpaF
MGIHQTKGVGTQTATISRTKGTTDINDESLQVMDKMVSDEYYEYKDRIHDKLIDSLDLAVVEKMSHDVVRRQIQQLVEEILSGEDGGMPLNSIEHKLLITEIQDEVLGYGPIEPFLQDPTISDILINTYKHIYIERRGKLELTDGRFKDDKHLRRIIDKIVSQVGRRIDESSPMVDARLQDGSRVNVIIPPLAIDGPVVSIRRFAEIPLELEDLISLETIKPELGDLLKGIVQARLNVLISGGTGSGKTTFLNVLSRFIPEEERIVVIEDATELQLKQEHNIRLETRPANIEGQGEISQRELVKNSLRMRPDRIIVGEVRGGEAFDMLQAMNTGHEGSLTTIHANSTRDAIMRLETMVAMTQMDIPLEFMRKFIASAIDVVIQVSRLSDGTRKVISLEEITGMEGNVVTMQQIFVFNKAGIDSEGKVMGDFEFTGVRPAFIEKLELAGIKIPRSFFNGSERTSI